ncbi:hypothetical protein THAOC_03400, partial [Thalassiosira oceanica]
MGLKCSDPGCGATFQSYEASYVETLELDQRNKLGAIIVGKSDGIDMSLVIMARSGISAAAIQRTCHANLTCQHEACKFDFNNRKRYHDQFGTVVENNDFPREYDDRWVAKPDQIIRAFIRDYLTNRDGLNREMASLTSAVAMAIDHQAKPCRRSKSRNAMQTFCVVGDGGLILGFYCVPSDDMQWVEIAMEEIVARHGGEIEKTDDGDYRLKKKGALPDFIYVDKDCCDGKEGGRTEHNKFFFGMIKVLDAFHLILRIGREIEIQHGRKALFMTQLSRCIFIRSEDDAKRLKKAQEKVESERGAELSAKEKRSDARTYVRRVIGDRQQIVSKILLLVQTNMAMDREMVRQYEESGGKFEDLNRCDDAYPLITKKQQGRGSPLRRWAREIYWDAQVHWELTNSNRRRLSEMGKDALPLSVAPTEMNESTL